jgi:hypothetical protein
VTCCDGLDDWKIWHFDTASGANPSKCPSTSGRTVSACCWVERRSRSIQLAVICGLSARLLVQAGEVCIPRLGCPLLRPATLFLYKLLRGGGELAAERNLSQRLPSA